MAERVQYCRRFVTAFVNKKAEIALELTMQMGRCGSRCERRAHAHADSHGPARLASRSCWARPRPATQTPGEVNGTRDRATYMIDIAEESLKDIEVEPKDGAASSARPTPPPPPPPALRAENAHDRAGV